MSVHPTQLVRFPAIREALGIAQNHTILAMCRRHNIPVVNLSSRARALRLSDYEALLTKATEAA